MRTIFVIGIALLPGCGRAPVQPKPVEKVSIVATVYPLADVARQVGGSYVDVSWIIETGQSVDGVELSSSARNRLRSADLLFMSGITEPWASEGISNAFQPQRVLRLDSMKYTVNTTPETQRTGYLWLDPVIVRNACREMCDRLVALRPQFEKQFRTQTDDYVSKLDALMAEYRPRFAAAQSRRLLVLDTDFNRMLDRFGLQAVPTVDVSPMRLTDSDLRVIRQIAQDNGTRLLVLPADIPSAVTRDLELRGGIQIIKIDCLGSSSADGRNSYLQIMRFNLEQLLNATSVH